MVKQESAETGEARALAGRGFGLPVMLLAFALAHCGGKQSSGQPESGGASIAGESSVMSSAGSGSSSGGSAGQGNIQLDPGSTSGGSDVSACNALDDLGSSVSATVIANDPPKPEGGTIPNGLFHLIRREVFVGRNGNRDKSVIRATRTLLVSASTGTSADLQLVWLENPGELPHLATQNQTLVVSGTSYDFTVTCSSELAFAQGGTLSFTATAHELIWISPASDGATYVDTFERQ